MDNLAHALVGTVSSTSLFPGKFQESKKKFIIATTVVANSPDIDVLLGFWGLELYHFHHRGFTHSFFGLLLMLPLCVLFLKKIMKFSWSTKEMIYFSLFNLLFGHFFLDWLTTYGTMFLYPFSMARFSFPLMFIIDPVVWTIGLFMLGLLVFFAKRSIVGKKIARWGIFLFCTWWAVLLGFKHHVGGTAESLHSSHTSAEHHTYPILFAPLNWMTTSILENDFSQTVWSLGRSGPRVVHLKNPSPLEVNQMCEGEFSPVSLENFRKYLSWGEHIVCDNHTFDNRNGCRCRSLKYNVAQLKDTNFFGSYWIHPSGEGFFLPVSREGAMEKMEELMSRGEVDSN